MKVRAGSAAAALLCFAAGADAQWTGGGTGSPSCPCLPSPPDLQLGDCINVNVPAQVARRGSIVDDESTRAQMCFPLNYGVGSCEAWDAGSAASGESPFTECRGAVGTRPDWCSRSWCWVDGACSFSSQPSAALTTDSAAPRQRPPASCRTRPRRRCSMTRARMATPAYWPSPPTSPSATRPAATWTRIRRMRT